MGSRYDYVILPQTPFFNYFSPLPLSSSSPPSTFENAGEFLGFFNFLRFYYRVRHAKCTFSSSLSLLRSFFCLLHIFNAEFAQFTQVQFNMTFNKDIELFLKLSLFIVNFQKRSKNGVKTLFCMIALLGTFGYFEVLLGTFGYFWVL